MYPTVTTTVTRRFIGAGIISGVAVLAACNDSTTAPQAPVVPKSASAVTLQGGNYPPPSSAYVTFRVADTTGATLKETGWTYILTTNPIDSIAIGDNEIGDLDPAVGYIKAKVPKAQSYKACFDWSLKYAGDLWGSTYKACGPQVTSTAQTVAVGVTHGKRNHKS